MPDPEIKKPNDPRETSENRPASGEPVGALRDESNIYGDEADISVRRRRKAELSEALKKATARRKAPAEPEKTAADAFPKVAPSKKKKKKKAARKKRRTYHSVFEIMSATGPDSLFRPVRVFGHEIRFWPLILLAALVILGGGVMLNNSNLSVTEQTVTVVGLPEDLEGYRIIVLSDMNARRFGDSQSLLLRTLNGLKYDAIFCLGDMVGKSGNAQPFWEFIEGLRNPGKVYFICGDSDPGPYVRQARGTEGVLSQLVLEDWILGAIDRGAHYVDAPMSIQVRDATLWISPATMLNLEATSTLTAWQDQTEQEQDGVISGITDDYDTLPITTYRRKIAQTLYDAQRTMVYSDIHIALAHEPPSDDFIYTSEDHDPSSERFLYAPEVIVAGHFCGGVWRLPFIGAVYVPDDTMPRDGWFPAQDDVSGLSAIGDTQLYITRGLSTNGSVALMPFRLFNQPEISALTLTSTLPENMLEAGY